MEKTTTTKVWTPNEKQSAFIKTLETTEEGLTLAEVSEKVGFEVKSGTINTLLAKGLVETCGEREIVVQAKRKVKVYRLVK